MRLSKRIRRWAVYRIASSALWLFNRIPRDAAQTLGAWFGLAAWALLAKDRHRIVRHLTLAYGDSLSRTDKQGIGQQFFINSGRNLADFVRFRDHFRQEIAPLITIEGLDHYHAAFASGKGVFGVTGHIGHFELLAARMQMEGYPTAAIAREMYDPRLNRLLLSMREAVGLHVIPTTASPRVLLKWLQQNGIIGVLIDTDSFRVRSEFVDWFGRPAYTPIAPALIAARTGAALLPVACVRRPGNTYHVIIKQAVTEISTGDDIADARRLTQACVRVLESIINDHKDQWIWLHNRWHTRPPA